MTADHHTGASRRRALGATLVYRPIAIELVAGRPTAMSWLEFRAPADSAVACALTRIV